MLLFIHFIWTSAERTEALSVLQKERALASFSYLTPVVMIDNDVYDQRIAQV